MIVAGGAAYEGIVVPHGRETLAVIDAAGKKHRIRKTDSEEQSPSQKSTMPSGLLNPLSLEEVADLFAYLANDSSRSVARRNTTDAKR